MRVLGTVNRLLNAIGFGFDYFPYFYYRFYRWIWIFLTCSLLPSTIAYCLYRSKDIHTFTEVLFYMIMESMTVLKIVVYLCRITDYKLLYATIQKTTEERLEDGQGKRYVWAERRSHLVTMIYNVSITFSTTVVIFKPLIIVGLSYLNGTLQKSDWELPFNTIIYFPDIETSSLGYEIAYFNGIICGITIGLTAGVLDCLFVGLTIYVAAMFKDLQDTIGHLEKDLHKLDSTAVNMLPFHRKIRLKQFRRRLVQCIVFHNKTLWCLDEIQKCSGATIFIQYFGSSFVLCLVAFKITASPDIVNLLRNISLLISTSMELLLYSWFGCNVTIEGEKVAQVAAHLDWYRHNSDTRCMIRFIIMRAQRTRILMGYGFFQCNLESFTSVLQLATSTFTLLQSISEE